ncbi:DMT family transporter [Rhodospirillum sp. A1_3_36]|uniref:DMT family transporter n=1 Tax=Rhodospirillum sp. A1_3_36 TaxID=3391666 RepID=UPI0039A62C46
MNALLFATVVFTWGFTWFAVHLQLGTVPPEVSIFWRFLAAGTLLGLWLAATGRLRRAKLADHRWFAAMGLCLFGGNFLLIYSGTLFVASGIVSVLFTLATVFNAFNQWIFLGKRPAVRVVGGALCGILGVGLLFGETLASAHLGTETALGVGLVLAGTFTFSLGNMVSSRMGTIGMDLPNAAFRGMLWGSALLGCFVAVRIGSFPVDWSLRYLGSLAYLIGPGSLVGFLAYLSLVNRVGPDRAAYATVLFPLVALTVSTLFEGYHWTPWSLAGLPMILLGNLILFARLPKAWRPEPEAA